MDRHGELLVFIRVVEDGNFSVAGRNLSLTPSAVSKSIARIEDRLGLPLFRRSGRSVALTPEGEVFHRAALNAIAAFEATEASVRRGYVAHDTLRIRSMPGFAVSQLASRIPDFCRLHPALRLEIILTMEPGNLLEGGVDVAIHVGPLEDSSMIAHRFTSTRWIICASPAYLAERGEPTEAADLAKHECLNFLPGIPAKPWTLIADATAAQTARVNSRILSNHGAMLLALARVGAGIVQLTELQIEQDLRSGTLVELFKDRRTHDTDPIYAVYRSKRHLSPRIRVFLDFLDTSFSGVG